MRTLISKITILWLILFTTNITVLAGIYNPETLPLPNSSNGVNYITNPDGILSTPTINSLNNKLLTLEKEKGVKTLVIVIERIENDDPYQLAIDIGNKYGVGNKQNTGLIIVLATLDRSYYILTGEGLEKFLPDALCKRIENRVMVPHLKKGDWDNAMLSTVDAISGILSGESELQYIDESEDELASVFTMLVIIFVGFIGLTSYAIWKEKECPHCGQHKLQQTNSHSQIVNNGKQEITTKTYICKSCNKNVTRKVTTNLHHNGGGPFIGGGSFGGGGTSGRGFGSFGGGSFGGGGAGGRF